jgi:nitroreductase/Pyruvate/2-oxoacid:ferredoxin oxidoreductase delta subunit
MIILCIDEDKCIECKQCVRDCPERLFHENADESSGLGIYFSDPYEDCRQCGHCIAVCPVDAIEFEAVEKPRGFDGIGDPSTLISYDTLLQFLKARRAIRQFKSKPVPEDKINAVLEAMRYAPTALNSQRLGYIVITNPAQIRGLVEEAMNMFKQAVWALRFKWLLQPFASFSTSIKRLLTDFSEASAREWLREYENTGKDNVFHSAPCVVILYSPSYGSPGNEAGIALTHGMLAAQSLGLGTCWIGWAQGVLSRSRQLRALIGIPSGQKPWGVLALGYPDVKYHCIPPRKPIRVDRLE